MGSTCGSALISMGSFMCLFERIEMSGEIVAEKSIVCLSCGHSETIMTTSSRKPISSILSASSRTSVLT